MPRVTAVRALNKCEKSGDWSAAALQKSLKESTLSQPDQALCLRLFLGVVQNRMLLDYYIDNLCSSRPELTVRNLLRCGLFQLCFMDRIPPHAAVSETVAAAGKLRLSRAGGFINAVLRKAARKELPSLPEGADVSSLSIRYSHALWITEELLQQLGSERAEAVLAADNREAPVYIFRNPLCCGEEEFVRQISVQALPKLTDGYIRLEKGSPESDEIFRKGWYYVQDPAPRQAIQMAAPAPGEYILDACAAPGGKSFACAMLTGDRAVIDAADISERRLKQVATGARRLGLEGIQTLVADATEFRGGPYDLVIADVPCSGLGVIRKKPDIRFKTREEIRELPQLQLRILRNLAQSVRPGGRVLYSTCTWRSEENRGVVDRFLAENSEFEIREEREFWPDLDETDGFYACLMQRKKI